MDAEVEALIKRIEEIVLSAPRLPVVGKIVVDGDAVLELIDRIRATGQRGEDRARRAGPASSPAFGPAGPGAGARPSRVEVVRPTPGGLPGGATTRPEAPRAPLTAGAVGPGADPQTRTLLAQAEEQARAMIEEARHVAEQEAMASRAEADEYAAGVLKRLQEQLNGLLASVKKGIDLLETEQRRP